jgi:Organic solute transporter Ostalpha
MIMVPLYAISSLISLFSLGAAFVIDAIRDIYEVGPCLYVFNFKNASAESIVLVHL